MIIRAFVFGMAAGALVIYDWTKSRRDEELEAKDRSCQLSLDYWKKSYRECGEKLYLDDNRLEAACRAVLDEKGQK